jgi:hypothetical protein
MKAPYGWSVVSGRVIKLDSQVSDGSPIFATRARARVIARVQASRQLLESRKGNKLMKLNDYGDCQVLMASGRVIRFYTLSQGRAFFSRLEG